LKRKKKGGGKKTKRKWSRGHGGTSAQEGLRGTFSLTDTWKTWWGKGEKDLGKKGSKEWGGPCKVVVGVHEPSPEVFSTKTMTQQERGQRDLRAERGDERNPWNWGEWAQGMEECGVVGQATPPSAEGCRKIEETEKAQKGGLPPEQGKKTMSKGGGGGLQWDQPIIRIFKRGT